MSGGSLDDVVDAFAPVDVGYLFCGALGGDDAVFSCTRPTGHAGDHVATAGTNPLTDFCARWSA